MTGLRRAAAPALAFALVLPGGVHAGAESLPLNLTGNWCGQEKVAGSVLRVDQRRQEVDGSFSKSTKVLRFKGRLEGTRVKAAAGRLELEQQGDTLRVTVAQGNYAAYRGATFAKTCCGTCP